MVLDNDEFVQRWNTAGGSSEETLLETAWKGHAQVQSQGLASEDIKPPSIQFATSLSPLLNDSKIAPNLENWKHDHLLRRNTMAASEYILPSKPSCAHSYAWLCLVLEVAGHAVAPAVRTVVQGRSRWRGSEFDSRYEFVLCR
ncbi:hypothetical protein AC579_9533 [Pseudocercospora musae]|uniref:Uncharacterized protein n=1 Tax=Pseudocercospora musae TaxID=113226 RepID=A0A139GVB8_9PEZI|nr:hypothetical protein AC579_9533 [Pseudocercospora musae]